MAEDRQGTFNFPLTFETYSGTCTCGKEYNCQRLNVALEMAICCSQCGKLIPIGKVIKIKDIA